METQPEARPNNRPKKQLFGETLVESGLISHAQLQQVLQRQAQTGVHIGSTLINMGMIKIDDLLDVLSKKLGVPPVNLFKVDIDERALALLPVEKIVSMNVMPIKSDEHTVTLAMANPQDFMTISEIEFTLGKKVIPMVVPHFMLDSAFKSLAACAGGKLCGVDIQKAAEAENVEMTPQLMSILRFLVKSGASDMLLTAGVAPSIKISNQLKRLAMTPLTPADCERYARELMSEGDWETFTATNEFEAATTYPDVGRFRVTIYQQRNSVSIALRNFPERLPSLKELNLPDWIPEFALRKQGLILITGPAGQGKSTTLNTMVEIINDRRRCNIITLEDPVEYLYKHKKSNINQREIGRDTDSFYEGLKHVFRQAPDVIVVGEMRDKESFEIALRAANSGHLVLTTVNADNTISIIEKVINMFPPDQQNLIRMMLSDSLLLCLAQRLIPLSTGKGRILALERMINSPRIQNLIREEKTYRIRSQMPTGTDDFRAIDFSIADLVNGGQVTFDEGLDHTEDETLYRKLTGESLT